MSLGRWVRALRGMAAARVRRDDAAWERQRRELALLALDGAADLVTFRRDGLVWTTTAVRHTITRNLFVHGRHPRREVEALGAWLRARDRLGEDRPWAVDVGANVGAPTLFFARDLGRRVLAIEPVPANFDLLRRNVDANGMGDRVVCVAAAVASRPGVVTMLRPSKDGQCEVGTEAARERLAEDGAVASVEVPARPLDDLLAAHGVAPASVAFAWSDTQGFETEVLRSGTSLWRAGVPAFVEAWPEGLEAHGGAAAFVAAAEASFARFVASRDLVAAGGGEAPERPVRDLGPFLRALERQTDVLLLPPPVSG